MFGTRQQLAKIKLHEIELLDNRVKVSHKVKHLSIIFESDMSMNSQISHMCQSACFHPRNVKAVSRFIPKETVKTAVVSNVISRLDTEILFLQEYVIVENCLTLLHMGARSRDSRIYKTMQPE